MTNANDMLKAHAELLKVWPVKFAGPKPTGEMLLQYHLLGARAGKQCLAGAMSLRDDGVTNSEIQVACGNPQLNKMRGFVDDALLKRIMVGKRNGRDIYKHVVTPKGLQRIARAAAAAEKLAAAGETVDGDKPAKPAKKAGKVTKARKVTGAKAKRKPVEPVSDAPSAIEQVPAADTPQAETNTEN